MGINHRTAADIESETGLLLFQGTKKWKLIVDVDGPLAATSAVKVHVRTSVPHDILHPVPLK